MIEFKVARKEDIDKIAIFIARVNRNEDNHIGFCGTESEEIANSLIEDITDIPFYESFIIGIDNEKIVGVLGFDTDLESKTAEIWGPFVGDANWDIVVDMWSKMIEILPNEIEIISMFINKKNEGCLRLANNLCFSKNSEQIILSFEQIDTLKLRDIPITELSTGYYNDMKSLHDRVFPNTYYSGNEIIERLNYHRKVFIDVEGNSLTGYIYVEVNPKFGEGSIEFFAVDESQRGKGIGSKLLTMALKWIFTFDSINHITLCVNAENKKALDLYRKVGFKQKNHLCYFTKKYYRK